MRKGLSPFGEARNRKKQISAFKEELFQQPDVSGSYYIFIVHLKDDGIVGKLIVKHKLIYKAYKEPYIFMSFVQMNL